jgi:ferredoxin
MAVDVSRENLPLVREVLKRADQSKVPAETQILVRAPMPCGAFADCGVCAVILKDGWAMTCKDGPVFDFADLK